MSRFRTAAALAALSILVAGCSDDAPHLKELARYTPEILAREMLTVYKTSVRRATPKTAAPKGPPGKADDKEREAAKKYGPEFAPHDASGVEKGASISLDELAAGVAKKAGLVEGMKPDEILSKLIETIDAELGLPAAEKEKIDAALKSAFGSRPAAP